jgi:hypothetical protein
VEKVSKAKEKETGCGAGKIKFQKKTEIRADRG